MGVSCFGGGFAVCLAQRFWREALYVCNLFSSLGIWNENIARLLCEIVCSLIHLLRVLIILLASLCAFVMGTIRGIFESDLCRD